MCRLEDYFLQANGVAGFSGLNLCFFFPPVILNEVTVQCW